MTREQEYRAALARMLAVQEALMPGVRYIAVQNYAELNDAPFEARRLLALPEVRELDLEAALSMVEETAISVDNWSRNDPEEETTLDEVCRESVAARNVVRKLIGLPELEYTP
jgi:hypothetical protein